MIKKLFGVVVGAAAALQFDRWWSRRRTQLTPNALTGSLLDKINRRLESNQSRAKSGGSGRSSA
jgi:hypothetical protein